MGKRKHRVALGLGIAMDGVWPDIRSVGHQPIKDMGALVGAAGNEMAEQRNELVGDMVIADTAIAAVADVVLGNQVLLVEVPFRAVGRGMLA
ncbi:hypothetical protein SDC9_189519 [bioreactor metagenome]|uniref:Uncharacterized protein n=1 Tax=bioreactor metagenome TaxID=1076179 RepID=A0A645I0L1_9ZZZZ